MILVAAEVAANVAVALPIGDAVKEKGRYDVPFFISLKCSFHHSSICNHRLPGYIPAVRAQ